MDIALVSDENYFCGLWATILSLLASTQNASSLHIYVMDSGISDTSWQRLANAVGQHPSPPKLIRKIFPREILDARNFPGNRSNLTYARLFMPDMLDCDRILYLDADLLIFKDVLELEKIDLNGHAGAAVLNEDGSTLDFDLTLEECLSLSLDPKSNYFNAGVFYMNLDYWRKHDLSAQCFEYIANNECRIVDQSAINAVANDSIKLIHKSWNRLANFITPDELLSPDYIIHYTSRNPWVYKDIIPSMLLWKKFAKDTGFSISPPQYRLSVYERYLVLATLRTMAYAMVALWYSILRRTDKVVGYSYAFTYWVKHASTRNTRRSVNKAATDAILNTNYRPAWLAAVNESASCEETATDRVLSTKKLPIKGKLVTSILRNRGRTREMLSHRIENRLKSRLEAIIKAGNGLRISDAVSDVAVSLTTWPPRERTLPLVLLTILEQSSRPKSIYVWLSHGEEGMINAEHKAFFQDYGVEFHVTKDIVPHKKWLPLLEMGRRDPFVIIDDDTYYPRNWLKHLVSESQQYPGDIVAHRCHKILLDAKHQPLPYDDWLKDVDCDGQASHYIFPTGCGGVMIQPDAISEDFRSRDLIKKLCPIADDIWLKAAYLQSGYKCRKSHYSFPCFDYPGTRESGLAVENVDNQANDRQLRDVLSHFDLKLD